MICMHYVSIISLERTNLKNGQQIGVFIVTVVFYNLYQKHIVFESSKRQCNFKQTPLILNKKHFECSLNGVFIPRYHIPLHACSMNIYGHCCINKVIYSCNRWANIKKTCSFKHTMLVDSNTGFELQLIYKIIWPFIHVNFFLQFVCLQFIVPFENFFTHMETSSLLVKGCKF